MALTKAFEALKRFSEEFNTLLNEAKMLCSEHSDIQDMDHLVLGPPDKGFDVYDAPLALEQTEMAKNASTRLL